MRLAIAEQTCVLCPGDDFSEGYLKSFSEEDFGVVTLLSFSGVYDPAAEARLKSHLCSVGFLLQFSASGEPIGVFDAIPKSVRPLIPGIFHIRETGIIKPSRFTEVVDTLIRVATQLEIQEIGK